MRVIAGRFAGIALQTPRSGTRPTTDRTKEALFSHLDAEGILTPGSSVLDLFAGTGALAFEALSRGADHAVLVDCSPQAVALIKKAAGAIRRHASWDTASMGIDVLRLPAEKAVDRLVAEQEHEASAHPFGLPAGRVGGTADDPETNRYNDHRADASMKHGAGDDGPVGDAGPEASGIVPFDVVFLDPPYAYESADLARLIASLTTHGLVSDDGEIVIERSTRSQPVALPEGWKAGKPKRYGETSVTYAYKA